MNRPRLAAAASNAADTREATRSIARSLRRDLGLDQPDASGSAPVTDFAIAFFTPAHAATLRLIGRTPKTSRRLVPNTSTFRNQSWP